MTNKKNPFSISKAVDLTDNEIEEMWVDGMDFEKFIEPTSLKPKMIIGGKGTGKTHLMRYFSYGVRLKNNNIRDVIKNDKCLCIFIQGGMLQSQKFAIINDKDKEKAIFFYYFGLFVLNAYLMPLLIKISKEIKNSESIVITKIKDMFDKDILNGSTLDDLQKEIKKEIKKINYSINNHSFEPNLIENIDIAMDAESLFFGIPVIIKEVLNCNALVINYFIDQFEDFTSSQQKYIQTLIRDSGTRCTFRLGIRSHAYNPEMLETEKKGEPNKRGSEIESVILDDYLKPGNDKYNDFIVEVIQKRERNVDNKKQYKTRFTDLFKEPEDIVLNSNKAFEKLKRDLNVNDEIIENLKVSKDENNTNTPNALIEKINIYLLHKEHKKSQPSTLLEISCNIQQKCIAYIQTSDTSIYGPILEKYKENLMAQLYKENAKPNPIYFGLDNLIKISNNNPRHFINFMSFLYNYADYYGEDVSQGFSVKIQELALDKTLSWFEDDYYKSGKYGDKQQIFSDRICRYLQVIRLDPKPKDTSVTKFYISKELYLEFRHQFRMLCGNRILIEKGDRPSKQSGTLNKDESFQINFIYSKKYTLPIISRGTVSFEEEILDTIFNSSKEKYDSFITKIRKTQKNKSDNQQKNLF